MVSVITCTIRNKNMENVFQNFNQQTYKKKELIIVLNNDKMNIKKWRRAAKKYKNVRIYQLSSKITLGDCMNYAVGKAKYDYIAKFDDDDFYGPHYLTETMQTFKETGTDIVGKRSVFVYMEQTKSLMLRARPEMENVRDATLLFHKRVWKKVRFKPRNRKSFWIWQNKAREKGFKIETTSKYNYTYSRRAPEDHTFSISDKSFMKKVTFVAKMDDYKEYVQRDPSTLRDAEGK